MTDASVAGGDGGSRPDPAAHDARVRRLLEVVRADRPGPLALRKDTSNLFRDPARPRGQRLDVRAFDHVLAVDADAHWIEAEGTTPYETLVDAALARGVLPAVVPELKSITLGGAAAGVGIEASAFKYGLVHETLLEIDVLTGDGRVLSCSPANEHRDLFYGFANSYGTLGYALRLKAATVPVAPFVALQHRRFGNAEALFAAVEGEFEGDADFLEGVAFAADELCLTTGRFAAGVPYTSDYTYENIYYRSLRQKEVDYLSVRDFIWRWDTDWFWCSRNLGAEVPWLRRLYGRKRLGSRTYQRIMRWNARWGVTSALDRLRRRHGESVIQDVDIPIANAAAFLHFFQREIGIAPIWICPFATTGASDRFPLYPLRPGARYVNFGFWDVIRTAARQPPHHFNRLVEQKVAELGGIKSLYSDSFYDRAAFDRIYGGETYRVLKTKYDPGGAFPDLFDKCVSGL